MLSTSVTRLVRAFDYRAGGQNFVSTIRHNYGLSLRKRRLHLRLGYYVTLCWLISRNKRNILSCLLSDLLICAKESTHSVYNLKNIDLYNAKCIITLGM